MLTHVSDVISERQILASFKAGVKSERLRLWTSWLKSKQKHQKGQIVQLKTTSSQQLYIFDTLLAVVISENVETPSDHSSAYNLALSCNLIL